MYELLPFRKVLWNIGKVLCSAKSKFQKVCALLAFQATGYDWEEMSKPIFGLMATRVPDDISLKQILHYSQLVLSKEFQQYDFGKKLNRKYYGSNRPPLYDLSKVTAPVEIVYSKNDFIVAEEDVDLLARKLPNLVDKYLIPYERFNHLDYFVAKDIKPLVLQHLVRYMHRYDQ